MGPAIVLFAQTAVFWIRHHNIDEDAYMTYDSESDVEDDTALSKDSKVTETGAEKVEPIYTKN